MGGGEGIERLFVSRKISMHSLYVWARPEKKRKNIDAQFVCVGTARKKRKNIDAQFVCVGTARKKKKKYRCTVCMCGHGQKKKKKYRCTVCMCGHGQKKKEKISMHSLYVWARPEKKEKISILLSASSCTILPTNFPKLAGLHAPVLRHTHRSFRWPG